jgi:hypothetical protein
MLTKTAKENTKAVALYEAGKKAGKKFSTIEKEIIEATSIKNPMYPRNAPYFTVNAEDFEIPEMAAKLVDTWGSVDEDGVKRLHRFPVVFLSNDPMEILPHMMRSFGGDVNYQSRYGDDGVRRCVYLPPVTAEQAKQQRAARQIKQPRREFQIRGECVPAACPEFLCGKCKFEGTLRFWVPGLYGCGVITMRTGSEYAAEAMWERLVTLKEATGYIPPMDNDKAIWMITKVQEQRVYFDENGKKCTGLQWVPRLDCLVDMTKLMALAATSRLSLGQAPIQSPAVQALIGATLPEPVRLEPHPQDSEVLDADIDAHNATATAQATEIATTQPAKPDPQLEIVRRVRAAQDATRALLKEHNIDRDSVWRPFLATQYGDCWKDSADAYIGGLDKLRELLAGGREIAISYMMSAIEDAKQPA